MTELNWTNVCFHHLLNNLDEGEINEQTTFLLFLFFLYVPQRQSAQKWKIKFEISSQVKTGFLPDTFWNSFLILWTLLITDVYVLFMCIYKQNSFGIGFCLTSFILRNASNTSFHLNPAKVICFSVCFFSLQEKICENSFVVLHLIYGCFILYLR